MFKTAKIRDQERREWIDSLTQREKIKLLVEAPDAPNGYILTFDGERITAEVLLDFLDRLEALERRPPTS